MIACDLRAAAHGEAAVEIRIHAALGRRVAVADRAAGHVERAAHKHAAALVIRVVAGNGAAVHVESAAAIGIHAAAVAAAVAVGGGRLVAADLASVHDERAIPTRIHAAALVLRVVAGNGAAAHVERHFCYIHAAAGVRRRVVGDAAAGHSKLAGAVFTRIHATALGRLVVGDLAAGHLKLVFDAGSAHIHAAAFAARLVLGDLRAAVHGERAGCALIHAAAAFRVIACDLRAAAHGECTGVHRHAAATAAFVSFVIVRRVVGDAAAVHIEFAAGRICCAVAHHHAAAHVRLVVGDLAAVHIEFAAVHHHAAAAHFAVRLVLGDLAAEHKKFAALYHHAAACIVCSSWLYCVGDLAVCGLALALAVGEGEAVEYADGVIIDAIHRDAVAVQAEHNAVNRLPSAAQLHICVQVVIAHGVGQRVRARPLGKGDGMAGMPVPGALVPAAEVVLMRLYQHQTGLFFVDRDRIPVQIALELLRVPIVQACAGGDSHTSRRVLRGHADACAVGQSALADDDGIFLADQIHIVIGGALLVVLDDHLAGNGKLAAAFLKCGAAVQIYAAAVAGRRVVFDLAAAHGERITVHIHAAAAACLVAADAAAAHDKRAEIHVHIHAAAEAARRVFGNAAAGHGERALVHLHAAAVVRRVVGDLAAVHIECAGLSVAAHAHAAALACAGVAGRRVVRDAAAVVQIKRAAAHIHAAAVAFAAAGYLRHVVRDAAAAHMKRAAAHVHAAAVAGSAGAARRRVVGDLAAVHINRAAGDLHAAAVGSRVARDLAAVQIKLAAVDLHAAAVAVVGARDLARARIVFAIRQGQRAAGYDLKHGLIFGCAFDRLAVQADGDGARDLNGMLDRNILTRFQIIVAAAQNILTVSIERLPICIGFVSFANFQCIRSRAGQPLIKVNITMVFLGAAALTADAVVLMLARRQRLKLAEPLGQRRQLLRVLQLCLLFFVQGFIIRFAGGLKRLVDRHGILVVHAVQFRRVRQSVDHRLHGGHGLLCGRILLLFFLFRRLILLLHFRRLALLLRFRRLALLLHFRRLALLLRFPVCRVCRFLHGRGRLRRPLRLLCQRRRGQQRQAQGQRHETAQDTLLHRFPPSVSSPPGTGLHGQRVSRRGLPYGPGGAPGHLLQVHGSSVAYFPRLAGPSARNVLNLT